MKKGIKKAIACTLLVGMAQFGLAATATIEASPRGDRQQQEQQQNRGERQRQENVRHEREMQRHNNESDRAWNDRQWQENQDHERNGRQIDRD